MKETGNKERIITILSKFESGLTYKNLLERYKEINNENLENGYVYLKRLKEKGIIETYKTPNIKGKNLTYRLVHKVLEKEKDTNSELIEYRTGYKQLSKFFNKTSKDADELFTDNGLKKYIQMIRENINVEKIKELDSRLIN